MLHLWILGREVGTDFFSAFALRRRLKKTLTDDLDPHLDAAMAWLKAAAEQGRGGVSSHYSLIKGRWLDPFPETTGYIIPTLYDYARIRTQPDFAKLAEGLAEWLESVQMENGACIQGTWNPERAPFQPIVFNTGQNIFGFLRAAKETGRGEFLDAAARAGNFLVTAVDESGIWNRALHHGIPHTYNSRTAWALLRLNEAIPNPAYVRVARANLDWVVRRQRGNGWFENANFKPGELPNTHGIAYTLRGLLESHLLTDDRSYLDPVLKTLGAFRHILTQGRAPYTFWDEDWQNHGKYLKWMRGRHLCLTGMAQLAIVCHKLYGYTRDDSYLGMGDGLLAFVLSTQQLAAKQAGIRGGIKGAFPVYGSYSALKYPNWATKFAADALIIKIEMKKNG